MNTYQIYKNCINDWGKEKELYSVSYYEMEILLLDAGIVIIEINKNNNDGTFYTEIQYRDKKFAVSSVEKFKNGP